MLRVTFVLCPMLLLSCGKRTTDEGLASLESQLVGRIEELERQMEEKDAEIASLNEEVATLAAELTEKADAEPLLWLDDLHEVLYTLDDTEGQRGVYVDGANLVVTSANLYVQSGLGTTADATNARGNIILGYDESSGSEVRTGSHNLVVGPYHSYSSTGGLVVGTQNAIRGPGAVVLGGESNVASGANAVVIGGAGGEASGDDTLVAGGSGGAASALGAVVLGGEGNAASGESSIASGGLGNTASGSWSVVVGGYDNEAGGEKATVGGGYRNNARAEASSVSCGSMVENDVAATCAP